MLPKVVLSWVGRLVGIAAVMASPLIARAAEATEDGTTTTRQVHRATVSGGHSSKSAKKKRGARHEAPAGKLEKSDRDEREAKVEAKPARTTKSEASKNDDSDLAQGTEGVIAEHASNKAPPKPSKTPLPTIAAAATVPRMEVIATCEAPPIQHEAKAHVDRRPESHADKAEPKSEKKLEKAADKKPAKTADRSPEADTVHLERVLAAKRHAEHLRADKGHGIEPRTSPIIRATVRTTEEPAPVAPTHKAKTAKAPCLHAPVEVTRGTEEQSFSLTKCDGSAAPLAVEEMSVLVRPGSAALPSEPVATLAAKSDKDKKEEGELAPGIKRIDGRLVERLQILIDHFAKPGKTPKMFVVSGYRPTSKGSFHAMGRAIDFRLEGVENTDLVAFCKTIDDTGCGFYPNSSFIHLDVRDAGTGHVAWIDASSPGDKPDYVAAWPLPPKQDDEDPVKILARMDELQVLPTENASDTKKTDEDSKDDDADSEPGILLKPIISDKKRHATDE